MTTNHPSKSAAHRAILSDLGHDQSGSLAAQLELASIHEDDSSDRLAHVYTHPSLPGREYVVGWGEGATLRPME